MKDIARDKGRRLQLTTEIPHSAYIEDCLSRIRVKLKADTWMRSLGADSAEGMLFQDISVCFGLCDLSPNASE